MFCFFPSLFLAYEWWITKTEGYWASVSIINCVGWRCLAFVWQRSLEIRRNTPTFAQPGGAFKAVGVDFGHALKIEDACVANFTEYTQKLTSLHITRLAMTAKCIILIIYLILSVGFLFLGLVLSMFRSLIRGFFILSFILDPWWTSVRHYCQTSKSRPMLLFNNVNPIAICACRLCDVLLPWTYLFHNLTDRFNYIWALRYICSTTPNNIH